MSLGARPEAAFGWARRGTADDYLVTSSVHCECCGRMIVGDAWVAAGDGGEHIFCEPACEQLYRSHWLPRHG
ncbi:MAG: hypothetical protein ACYC0H_15470, partial [Solirubrobacteraceae bacterium]